MDIEDIQPGQNFAQTIEQTIATCGAVLVIIGPRWMEILRNRAKQGEQDYVCREIEEALKRNATIIPVLVGGANMAQLTNLPESLTDLTLHQAAELRDTTFKEDCSRLTDALRVHPGLDIRPLKNKVAHRRLILGIGGSTAFIALLVAVSSFFGIGPLSDYQAHRNQVHQLLSTAETQTNQAEYESAFKTYQDVLNLDPGNRTAMEGQVNAAMLWLQNFQRNCWRRSKGGRSCRAAVV